MADSIDRVFVHALNTVKKIPKTGATRPPPADRMRLYGLYKQAMEGDVDGVMERPSSSTMPGSSADDVVREQAKWDAWNSQRGLGRTEAKRRYVEALIETMHRYANTPNALELVGELEFVWAQVKRSVSASSGGQQVRRFQEPRSGTEGPMRVLSPMSEQDESERRMVLEEGDGEEGEGEGMGEGYEKRGDQRSRRMERAIVRLSAEVAALREQIATGREWRSRKERSPGAWVGWGFWVLAKHLTADLIILFFLVVWFRRRKERRFETHVRGALRVLREYARKVLPSR
ncbi:acyl CoA binding protein-domain-containing protein [Schizothecium vesticola]|uniref:Acyl CoA binding protein-domain-containing protein n=1 Tax=Schizothecium vesticola TaxID=314040 RepID=A0AA40EJT0_9PEZI|nr:acyl CoA binding protein-domain-containing protein [Schizothecium vesticola]